MLEATPFPIRVSDETFAQLCAENELVRLERTAEGALEVMAPSGAETSRKLAEIVTQLGAWNRRTRLGVAFGADAAFRLPNGAIRGPDATWIAAPRWEALPPEVRAAFPPICPDFVLELLSPSDSLPKTRAQMREYQEQGARLGWLVDPRRRVVEIFRRAVAGSAAVPPDTRIAPAASTAPETPTAPETLIAPESVSGEDVLPGFVLDLSDAFA